MFFDRFTNGGAPGISAERLNEPFDVRSAAYDGSKIVVTIGRGRARYGDVTVSKAAVSTLDINAPAPNTTYYIWLRLSDSTFQYTTNAAAATGCVLLGTVATGATLSQITVADGRSMLPDAMGRKALDVVESHIGAGDPHPQYALDSDLQSHRTAGGSEHPAATGSVAGFMAAADKAKLDASTSAATAGAIMQRDAQGRAKVAAPAAADDIARKDTVDAVSTSLTTHKTAATIDHPDGSVTLAKIASAALTSPGGTEAGRIPVTNASGRVGAAATADQLGGVAASAYCRQASGSYVGDGAADRVITVGFRPKLVVLGSDWGGAGFYWGLGSDTGVSCGMYAVGTTGTTGSVTAGEVIDTQAPIITANGFQVDGVGGSGWTNYSGKTYSWVAFG
ncbi:MAG: hypothetical protein HPY55_06525 [Firmicutes bacterium]|nr:hypothetical protein [Bacillota bacterium]